MNTSNLFEPPAPPAAAGNDGVEVQVFGGNYNEGGGEPEAGGHPPPLHIFNVGWNLEIDTEAGVQGHEHDGAAAANHPPNRSWNKQSKFGYRGKALAVLVSSAAAGSCIGIWQNKKKRIDENFQSSVVSTAKTPKSIQSRQPKPKSSKSKATSCPFSQNW